MDFRNSGLIVCLYVLLGLAVAGIAGLSWLVIRQDSQITAMLQVESVDDASSAGAAGQVNDAFLHQRQEAFAEAARRIKQLEGLLERKTELLNRRTELLAQRSAEYDALRREADRYLMLLVEQVAGGVPPEGAESQRPQPSDNDEQAREAMLAELARLRQELEESALLESMLETELEQLRQELQSAQDRLTEAELRDLLGNGTAARRPLATEALVRAGAEAVGVLTASLRDERADIRLWAAEVLAEMGPAARPAVPLLRTAQQDTDPAVRQAARRALAAITAGEP